MCPVAPRSASPSSRGRLLSPSPTRRVDPSLGIWQDRRDGTASSALWEGQPLTEKRLHVAYALVAVPYTTRARHTL